MAVIEPSRIPLTSRYELAKFKVAISEPETGKASVMELEGVKAKPLLGREVGDTVDGSLIGVSGKKVRVSGGSDKDGIPLRQDVHGGGKKHLVLTNGVGFRGEYGDRKRRLVRGRTITEDTYQINLTIIKSSSEEKPESTQKQSETVKEL